MATKLPESIRQEGIRSAVDAPIVVEGRIWGAINVASRSGPLDPDLEQRIVEFTELMAMAIANADARAALSQSRPDRGHRGRKPSADRARPP